MEWPPVFYEWRSGKGCPACEQGRPEETDDGVRFFAGELVDADLRRSDIQRGLTVAIWRGRHVVEPTELTEEETWPLVTSNHVRGESWTFLRRRIGHADAVGFLD